MLENVEGIISSKLKGGGWNDPEGTPVLLHVLRELERTGYKCTWGIFSASEVGAPHQRKRVFIVGMDDTEGTRSWMDSRECRDEGGNSCGGGTEGIRQGDGVTQDMGIESSDTGSEAVADTDYFHRSTPPERWKHDRKAGPAGEELADPSSEGCERKEWCGETGKEGASNRHATKCGSKELADPSEPRSQRNLPDATEEGWQDAGRLVAGCCEDQWPARPGEEQYEWEEPRVVADSNKQRSNGRSDRVSGRKRNKGELGEEVRKSGSDETKCEAKSELGRATNGTTSRVDRLRLLGNGVVPQTAERAVRVLVEKLLNDE